MCVYKKIKKKNIKTYIYFFSRIRAKFSGNNGNNYKKMPIKPVKSRVSAVPTSIIFSGNKWEQMGTDKHEKEKKA